MPEMVTTNDPWVIESPVTMVEGSSAAFTIQVVGATTVASPTCAIYNNQQDTSSTNLTGSASVSGNVITTKIVGTVKGGERYILATTATVDGRTDVYLLEIRVIFPWGA
jgi:hypothetical protein